MLGCCETCKKELGNIKLDSPLYCVGCIEEMDRLGMTPGQYKKKMLNARACPR